MTEPVAARREVLYLVVCAAPPARQIDELITLLAGQGWMVCVIPTPRAAEWLDGAALTSQTGFPVRSDYKRLDDPDTLPRADAVVVVPATFNTVNKWAAGISDTFALGILNEAIGLPLPVIAVPYAKPTLAAHPAFADSLAKLEKWGVQVLPNEVIRRKPVVSGDPQGFDWAPVVTALANLRS